MMSSFVVTVPGISSPCPENSLIDLADWDTRIACVHTQLNPSHEFCVTYQFYLPVLLSSVTYECCGGVMTLSLPAPT
jgi:hypothetical protein